jgi:hypothetical protein
MTADKTGSSIIYDSVRGLVVSSNSQVFSVFLFHQVLGSHRGQPFVTSGNRFIKELHWSRN